MNKGEKFWQLHRGPGAFAIPNPWDAGSARLLAQMGFAALATTSAGFAFSMGRRDNTTSREEMMAHVAAIASAVPDTPVSGDLENGFGDRPEDAAETIRLAAAAGLVGGSIEDAGPDGPYGFELAVERVRAAVEAARGLPVRFTLTARCENFLVGHPDLADAIRRLQAFEQAGADVLYAPGLAKYEDIETVVRAVSRPVNVLAMPHMNLAALSAIGVRRVSVGSGMARAAYGAMLRAGREMLTSGTFVWATEAVSFRDITEAMSRSPEV